MPRLARRPLALAVAVALVVLSPGLEAPRAFAQAVGRGPVVGASPAAGAEAASAAASAAGAYGAVPLAQMALPLSPGLSAAAGAAPAAPAPAPVSAAPASAPGAASAAADSPAPAPSASGAPAAVAPAPAGGVDSAALYRVQRFLLKTVAALTGDIHPLSAAGPALTEKLIASAADKKAVFADIDDTSAPWNTVLTSDMAAAYAAVKAAGKHVAFLSDRGAQKKGSILSVFDSLSSLPAETRAGMYVAAESGGRVYRYGPDGEPALQFETPPLDAAAKAKIAEASAAAQARLRAELGVEVHVPGASDAIATEAWGPYHYALMLKADSERARVVAAAGILQQELARRGLDVEVAPRFAKDPANPPYINFSIATKQKAAEHIARALNLEARDVVVIGDSMYAPGPWSRLARLVSRLSGRALPMTGNRTDFNMEKAVPGALTLAVGSTGDPRASNLWVLADRGPSVVERVLRSMASGPRAAEAAPRRGAELAHRAALALLVAAAAAGGFLLLHELASFLSSWEQPVRDNVREFGGGAALFGGVLGSAKGKSFIPESWKRKAEAARDAAVLLGVAAGVHVAIGLELLRAYREYLKLQARDLKDAQAMDARARESARRADSSKGGARSGD